MGTSGNSFLEKIKLYVSSRFFGNLSGIFGNIGGKINLFISRQFSDIEPDDRPDYGFRKLESEVSEEKVDAIVEKLEQYIQEGKPLEPEKDGHEVMKRMDSPHFDYYSLFPEALDIVDQFDEEVKSYFGSDYQLSYISIFRYPSLDENEAKEESVRSWHLDEYSPDHMRLFVYLSDTDKESGTMFLSRESTKEILGYTTDNFYTEIPEDSAGSDLQVDYLYGEKGTAALTNPMEHLHQGQGNPQGDRDILIFTFRPSPTGHPDDWKEKGDYDKVSKHHVSSLKRSINDLRKSLF
jgi:hypothetical protein